MPTQAEQILEANKQKVAALQEKEAQFRAKAEGSRQVSSAWEKECRAIDTNIKQIDELIAKKEAELKSQRFIAKKSTPGYQAGAPDKVTKLENEIEKLKMEKYSKEGHYKMAYEQYESNRKNYNHFLDQADECKREYKKIPVDIGIIREQLAKKGDREYREYERRLEAQRVPSPAKSDGSSSAARSSARGSDAGSVPSSVPIARGSSPDSSGSSPYGPGPYGQTPGAKPLPPRRHIKGEATAPPAKPRVSPAHELPSIAPIPPTAPRGVNTGVLADGARFPESDGKQQDARRTPPKPR